MRSFFYKAAVIAILTGVTLAQPPRGGGPGGERPRQRPTIEQLFQDMDQNKDQKLSKTEVKGPLQKHFSEIDSNKDGFLSADEIKNGSKKKPPRS